MTYGREAVVPVEIGLMTFRTSTYDDQQNEGQIRLNLDLIDEVQEKVERRMKGYQVNMAAITTQKLSQDNFPSTISSYESHLGHQRSHSRKVRSKLGRTL